MVSALASTEVRVISVFPEIDGRRKPTIWFRRRYVCCQSILSTPGLQALSGLRVLTESCKLVRIFTGPHYVFLPLDFGVLDVWQICKDRFGLIAARTSPHQLDLNMDRLILSHFACQLL